MTRTASPQGRGSADRTDDDRPAAPPPGTPERTPPVLAEFFALWWWDRLLVVLVAVALPAFEYGATSRTVGITIYLVLVFRMTGVQLASWWERRGRPARGGTATTLRWIGVICCPLALVTALVSAPFALNTGRSVATALLIGASAFCGPIAALVLARHAGLVRLAVGGFLAGQSVSALVALGQLVAPAWVVGETVAGRAPGLSGHPNILGLFAAIAVVVALGTRRRLPASATVAVVVVNLGALLVSGSLTALVALVVAGGAYAAVARAGAPAIGSAVLAGGLVLVVGTGAAASAGFVATPDRVLAAVGSSDGSAEVRLDTVRAALDGIARDPVFGAGLDMTTGTAASEVTHNVLVRAWFQGGLAMLALFLLVYAAALLVVRRALAHRVAATAAAVVVLELVFALVNASWDQAYFWAPLLLGLAVAATAVDRATGHDPGHDPAEGVAAPAR